MEATKHYALYIGKQAVKLDSGWGSNAGYGQAKIEVVEVDEAGRITNPGSEDQFHDLVFTCQWDRKKLPLGQTYAWKVRYQDVFIVDYFDAERMLKVLRKIGRIENKNFTVRPVTFGQYVTMVASGLGIKKLVVLREYRGSSYSDNGHQTLTIKDAQNVIDNLVNEAQEKDQDKSAVGA